MPTGRSRRCGWLRRYDAVNEFDGASYQARVDALAASGKAMHGEADFVMAFRPTSVLDAGCGTGRVAIELGRRGVDVVGVDVSASMIEEARRRGPDQEWIEADLAQLDLGRVFDVVVLAGNVPLFCAPLDRPELIRRCAAHTAPGGHLVSGFQLDGSYRLEEWDAGCSAAGLERAERWSSWDRENFVASSPYAVSVYVRRQ